MYGVKNTYFYSECSEVKVKHNWSVRTMHEQGNLYSESLFLSCPWLWYRACDVRSLFIADLFKNIILSSCVQSRWSLYRQAIHGRKDVSAVQQLKPDPARVRTLLGDNNTRLQSIKAVKQEKTLQSCTTLINLPSLDKKNILIQCNENDIHLKCWYCLNCGSGLKYRVRCSCQP